MIDWDRVDELRADFGEDDFVEIVTMFLAEVEEKLEEMCRNSTKDLSEEYHFLKGVAANLGFIDLQKKCCKAEEGGDPSNLKEIQVIFLQSKEMFSSKTQ